MKVRISKSKASGIVAVPPSKSVGHRALIAASLANGVSIIKNLGHSKDIEATVSALKCLGADISLDGDTATVNGKSIDIASDVVFCNESGSTLRFMIPLFALSDKEVTFTGAGKLMKRPQDVYRDLFREEKLKFEHKEDSIVIKGPLKSGNFTLDGSISSQFITGLLFALPLCEGDSTLTIKEPFESRSYVDITIDILNKFGIEIIFKDKNTLFIKGSQKYLSRDLTVEGDYSSAAFPALLGAINNEITITGLADNSKQGDKVFFDYLKEAGVNVYKKDETYVVTPGEYKEAVFDLADCPDLGPALMTYACFANKKAEFKNIARLRYKESDRVECVCNVLKKFGYHFDIKENELTVLAEKDEVREKELIIDSHNDHRLAMSFAVLATVSDKDVIITTAEAVNKSYPDFYEDLKKCGVKVEVLND
ncbi:MAG: 3-phosphoshikimate 1-carboxyvinyltransferase [Erysipelotrichaceae bacterium]|nr:3-phosphoshikimate 1-carboxyvinyltransferase [Erysipelotrichaceae bacterium]